MGNIRVVSIGAAVQDVFLHGSVFTPQTEADGDVVQEFMLGSKNEVEKVTFSTGGGATNAAVTFARQGLHSMYMGKIGNDVAGTAVLDSLHTEGVDTALVGHAEAYGTGYSCILLAPTGERTILTYRGASSHYDLTEADFHDVEADWMYISSLEGNFEVLEEVFSYAARRNIKVAINPGKKELEQAERLKHLLPSVTILSLNKEEMTQLFPADTAETAALAASAVVPYAVVTDGADGVVATDRHSVVFAGMYEDVPVIDRTGAGDAFCSGFTAYIAQGAPVEQAVLFASANSTSVVGRVGAKEGILRAGASLHGMPMQIKKL